MAALPSLKSNAENTKTKEIFADIPNVVDRSRKSNLPWVDFIYPQRFLVAKGTRMMKNCRWAGKFVAMPTKVLKQIKGIKNAQITHVPEEVARQEHDIWDSGVAEKIGRGYTCLWEIHDAATRKWLWIDTEGKTDWFLGLFGRGETKIQSDVAQKIADLINEMNEG